jgi:hypothetical protein
VDEQTWHDLVEASKHVHTTLMAEGYVTIPRIMTLARGRVVGVAHLRPVTQGEDAVIALGEMADFAAAANADQVVVAWENLDLCIACQHPPFHPLPALNMLWAVPDHYVLWRFPYHVRLLPDLTDDGRVRGVPQWLPTPPAVPNARLEPEIARMLDSCWSQINQQRERVPNLLELMAADLRSRGHLVELAARAAPRLSRVTSPNA